MERNNEIQKGFTMNVQDTNIIGFEREYYKSLCDEMKIVLTQEKELIARKETLKNELIEMSGGTRMEYGIKVQKREVKGSVDYKKIVTDLDVAENELETYRKPTRSYFEVRSY